jgi:hypothetical protein
MSISSFSLLAFAESTDLASQQRRVKALACMAVAIACRVIQVKIIDSGNSAVTLGRGRKGSLVGTLGFYVID